MLHMRCQLSFNPLSQTPVKMAKKSKAAMTAAGVPNPLWEFFVQDQWTQDYFETGWPVVSSRSELVAHESDFGRTWLVMGFPGRTTRRYPGVKAHLDEPYTLSKRLPGTLGEGDVLVWVESSPGRD